MKNKAYRFFLATIGFIFGFSANVVAQYGIPQSTYLIKGLVLSENNEKPIKDINVNFLKQKHITHKFITNENGEFFFYIDEKELGDTIFINVNDVDGSENGNFQQKDTIFKSDIKTLKMVKRENINNDGEIPFNIYLKPEAIKPKEQKKIDNN